jgi:hypothetical protein
MTKCCEIAASATANSKAADVNLSDRRTSRKESELNQSVARDASTCANIGLEFDSI